MESQRAGWPIPEWCTLSGISRPSFYLIPVEQKPTTVSIGRKVVVTEPPAAWLERMRQAGGVKTRKYSKREQTAAT